ncbi:hypothetical protein FA13DRAFT_1094522 [Coprinellus micaceus]|uniref:Integral membrane protein n=1 Tax=Coprinellus micaceus TaxID=71717 RepID=A0A4Y7TU22_COPMI|nr:hypothetical protein FA13DRAFT_1094522 [Coprinellus micaceus]
MAPPPGQDGSINEQVYTLVGFWLESMIYGLYSILFIAAMSISVKNWRKGTSFSLPLFLSQISMFIMISVYTFINLYRGIRAFALLATPPTPVTYYHDFTNWDNYAFVVIVTLLVWHADALVIYRCFIIWGRNYWVIVIPVLLLLLSFAVNTITLTSFKNPGVVPENVFLTFLQMVYPVNITQSILTTGLITLKIWMQHARTHSSGLAKVSSNVNLLTIIRIIIESALIFTLQQIILLILQQLDHPAQVILHATLVPSIGVVFVLMTLRTHIAKTESEARWNTGVRSDTVRPSTHRGATSHVAVFTTTTVREDHPMEVIDTKTARDSEIGSMVEDRKSRERF